MLLIVINHNCRLVLWSILFTGTAGRSCSGLCGMAIYNTVRFVVVGCQLPTAATARRLSKPKLLVN